MCWQTSKEIYEKIAYMQNEQESEVLRKICLK